MRSRYRKRKTNWTPFIIMVVVGVLVLAGAGVLIWYGVSTMSPSDKPAQTQTTSADGEKQQPTVDLSNYKTVQTAEEQVYRGELILVGNKTKYHFPKDSGLVNIYDNKNKTYGIKTTALEINQTVMGPLNTMLADFEKARGENDINIISSYRSYESQQEVYQEQVDEDGAEEAAKWVTIPGGSEHHTGLAVDFGLYSNKEGSRKYDGKGIYSWINENSYKYGFVVRYPSEKASITNIDFEPWHFRYVGDPHAKYMTENKLCLEEYIELLRKYSPQAPLKTTGVDGDSYSVYYVKSAGASTALPVPKTGSYTVSGNNIDGFIVTAKQGG